MPRRFTGKLCRFLADHLDKKTFSNLLAWVNKKEGLFRILWKHGNGADATAKDYVVFLAWDKLKNRGPVGTRGRKSSRKVPCHDTAKKRSTTREKNEGHEAKQRFRSALRKMNFKVESTAQGYQVMRFPKSDLDYLLQKERFPPSPNTSEGSDDTFASSDDTFAGLDDTFTGSDDSSPPSPGHASLEEGNVAFPLDNEATVTPFVDYDLTNYDMDSADLTYLCDEIVNSCGSSEYMFMQLPNDNACLLNSYPMESLQETPTPEPLVQEPFLPLSELLSPLSPGTSEFLDLQAADQISPEEQPKTLFEFPSIF